MMVRKKTMISYTLCIILLAASFAWMYSAKTINLVNRMERINFFYPGSEPDGSAIDFYSNTNGYKLQDNVPDWSSQVISFGSWQNAYYTYDGVNDIYMALIGGPSTDIFIGQSAGYNGDLKINDVRIIHHNHSVLTEGYIYFIGDGLIIPRNSTLWWKITPYLNTSSNKFSYYHFDANPYKILLKTLPKVSDSTPPTIDSVSGEMDPIATNVDQVIQCEISDIGGSGLMWARVFYRTASQSWDLSRYTTLASGQAAIPEIAYNSGDTVYYYIGAVDGNSNYNYRHSTGTTTSESTAQSNAFSFTVISSGNIPDAPVLETINPKKDTDGQVQLNWNDVPGATIYRIYRSHTFITSAMPSLLIGFVYNSEYIDTPPANGIYYYVVVALNSSGASLISNCDSVEVEKPNICPYSWPLCESWFVPAVLGMIGTVIAAVIGAIAAVKKRN